MSNNNILYSGGAIGADSEWDRCANLVGHNSIHFVPPFNGGTEKYKSIFGELKVIDDAQASSAHSYVIKANKTLKRTYPTKNNYINRILQRNYYQIKDVSSVYAVGLLDSQGNVNGGTAWAIQMFLDRMDINSINSEGINMCPVYIFDQNKLKWHQANMMLNEEKTKTIIWIPIDENQVPKPSGKYAGIGSRNITSSGREAIVKLYL